MTLKSPATLPPERSKGPMKSLLGLLLCCLSLSCLADEFRICSDNRGIPPYVYMDGVGVAQYLAIHAAQNLHLQLRLDYHPQPRCMAELAHGRYDALLIGSPNPAMDQVADFPKDAQGSVDSRLSYGHYRIVAFKHKGSPARWADQRFSGSDKPLLYQNGVPTVELVISRLQVPQLSSARTPQSMIEMMRLGRADIGVVMEPLLLAALRQADAQEEFEVLEPALLEANAYMPMGKQLMQRDPQLAYRFWNEIRRLRSEPHWQQLYELALSQRLQLDSRPATTP